MAIIVEDGSQVTNSNSYVTRAEYIAYAATLGTTITDDVTADEQLIESAIFIGNHESNLKGERVARDQSMAYPRTNLCIDGWYWNSDEIPRNVLLAQYAFALDLNAGIDLYNIPVNPNLIAKKERVEGAVSVELAVKDGGNQKATRTSTGDSLLASLLNQSGLMAVPLVRA